MQSQKNLPYYLHKTPNNAQNTQHKLGVAISYLERNNYHQLLVTTSNYQQLLVTTSNYQQLLVTISNY